MIYSRSNIDIPSLENIKGAVDVVKVVDEALVLILCPGRELSHAHVLDSVLTELFAPM